MASINKRPVDLTTTHQGGAGKAYDARVTLERLVFTCMLWEDTFYIDGKSVYDQIKAKVLEVNDIDFVLRLAHKNRVENGLRHASVLLLVAAIESLKGKNDPSKSLIKDYIPKICTRPDDLTEMVALYWQGASRKKPLTWQMISGVRKALNGYSAYSIAKYSKRGAVRLRDLLHLSHARPKDADRALLFKELSNDTIKVPDTWEVAISAAKEESEKRAEWKRLFDEDKLGDLALLRNLRNLYQNGISLKALGAKLETLDANKLFPFQLFTAAKIMPELTGSLDELLARHNAKNYAHFNGKTAIFVDTSGSMRDPLSAKGVSRRVDAACALSVQFAMCSDDWEIIPYDTRVHPIIKTAPSLKLATSIASYGGGGTYTYKVVTDWINNNGIPDRIIIITDEQVGDWGRLPNYGASQWIINIAPYEKGLRHSQWNLINGFSANVVKYVAFEEGVLVNVALHTVEEGD